MRVRFVPVLVYDDNEQNKKDNIAGQTVPLDMRGKVDYILQMELWLRHHHRKLRQNDI
ncbi:MAG: hypothetical protein ACLS9K_14275 [Lachnospira eligens]